MKKSIRIGNSSGFWGDDPTALYRQVTGGRLDYITSDYLAEVSMSILQKQQDKNADLGYVEDFIEHFVDSAEIISNNKIKLITNAGGNNPLACGRRILRELQILGIEMTVAVIEGDRVMHLLPHLYREHELFRNFETGESFQSTYPLIKSANAYVGLLPIVEALKNKAQIIIAGRVTDSAIAMAPMVYEFDWKLNDWDKLGAGMIAAHTIECGTQCTGGNFTDWHLIENWDNLGFPFVEIFSDGTFYVTKHEFTGGLVSVNTVKEQLLYEISDPKRYFSPDVIADLTNLKVEEIKENVVRVSGGKGRPPTRKLKVSMSFHAGFQSRGSIIISGPNVLSKAKKFEEIFWSKLKIDFEKKNTEYVGYNACHFGLVTNEKSNEILLQFYAFDKDRNKLEQFSKLLSSLILSGPPGVAVTSGRPKIQQIMAYWPTYIDKGLVKVSINLLNVFGEKVSDLPVALITNYEENEPLETEHQEASIGKFYNRRSSSISCKIQDLCISRSGDKGDCVNIGLIARNKNVYQYLKEILTPEVIKEWFILHCTGKVKRYELENLNAFNFFLEKTLDGGGTRSMRIDAQGKTFASALLNQTINVPKELLDDCS
jgi:hypothetical protein